MARDADDGRVWGRPEALDTLGRLPGRKRRSLGTLLGIAAIVAGTWVGFSGAAGGASPQQTAGAPTTAGVEATCASIGVTLDTRRIPAEGVAESSVVRLSRAAPDGSAQLLAPSVYVLKVTPIEDGIQMSVLVRTDTTGGDAIDQINGASADGSLSAAVLYDLDPLSVLAECRSGS